MSAADPTHDPSSLPEHRDPPGWPIPVGIISIALAGLGSAAGSVSRRCPSSPTNGDPLPPTLVFGPIDYAIAGFGLLNTVFLLFGGIMLVGRRPIARTLHLVYSVAAMPLSIFQMVRNFDKQSQMAQWATDYPNNEMAKAINSGATSQQIGEIFGLVLGVGIGIGFPLFVFIWFMLVKPKSTDITGTVEGVY
jgi:hypothetical protein